MDRTPLVAVTLALLLLLAGCAGAGDGGGATAGATTAPTTGTTMAPTAGTAATTGEGTPTAAGTADGSTPTAGTTATPPDGTLEVHFVNVGQSVSTLVVGPTGETMLVDSGDWRDDGRYVLDYLQARGVDRVDYLVSSHGDADHIGGNAAVIEYYETAGDGVGAIYDQGIASPTRTYERYLDAVERYDVPLYRTQAGDSVPLEGATVEVLGPPPGYLAGGERNENSVVLRVRYGETSLLLTGDAEDDGERYLVDTYGADLRATVLKAGHHGSQSSTSAALLDAADPQVVVVSSAYDSQYGHPDQVVLDRLAARSIPTYWTATHGHVVLVSTGERVTVRTQRAAPTDAAALRSADPVAPGSDDPLAVRATVEAGSDGPPSTVTATVVPREGDLAVTAVHADAAGDDRTNLNDEYVTFTNVGEGSLALGGYAVTDESGKRYVFPDGVVLDPGESVTLRTGSGVDTARNRYWDAGRPVWNNGGDTVTVRAPDGTVVLREAY